MYKQLNCSKEPIYNIIIINIKSKFETCDNTCIYTSVPKTPPCIGSVQNTKCILYLCCFLAPSYCINN